MKKRSTQTTANKKGFFNLALYKNDDLKNLLQQCNALYQSIYLDKFKVDDCQTIQACLRAETILRERQEKLNAFLQLLSEHRVLLERCRDVEQELKVHALSMKKFTLNMERVFDIIHPLVASLSLVLIFQGAIMMLVGLLAYPSFFMIGVGAIIIGVVLAAITGIQFYLGKKHGEKIHQGSKEKYEDIQRNNPVFQPEIDAALLRGNRETLSEAYLKNPNLFFNPNAKGDKAEAIGLSSQPHV